MPGQPWQNRIIFHVPGLGHKDTFISASVQTSWTSKAEAERHTVLRKTSLAGNLALKANKGPERESQLFGATYESMDTDTELSCSQQETGSKGLSLHLDPVCTC